MLADTIRGLEESGMAQPYVTDASETALIERLRACESGCDEILRA